MRTKIFVTLKLPGFHHWPEAPEPVAFLRDEHRHLFHITVRAEVTHDEREIEFVLLRERLGYAIPEVAHVVRAHIGCDFGTMSCEAIARALFEKLEEDNLPIVAVEVSEDGEFGAEVRKP